MYMNNFQLKQSDRIAELCPRRQTFVSRSLRIKVRRNKNESCRGKHVSRLSLGVSHSSSFLILFQESLIAGDDFDLIGSIFVSLSLSLRSILSTLSLVHRHEKLSFDYPTRSMHDVPFIFHRINYFLSLSELYFSHSHIHDCWCCCFFWQQLHE